jgi:hypothetical protein
MWIFLVNFYIDSELAPKDAGLFEEHLRRCLDCRRAYDRDRRLSASMRHTVYRFEAPSELRVRIHSDIVAQDRDVFGNLGYLAVGWNPVAIAASLGARCHHGIGPDFLLSRNIVGRRVGRPRSYI